MGMALDLGMVKGDMELAGAVWRNLLGARGARGIVFPSTAGVVKTESSADPASFSSVRPNFRRSVNLVGGEVVNVAKTDVEKEELRDDNSGVHDFAPEESERYVQYPELMLGLVGYVRRELVRLEALSDEEVMSGDLGKLKFGRVKAALEEQGKMLGEWPQVRQ